jgi:D-serine deaminase-like pyridoxal phosphate-dependent protein
LIVTLESQNNSNTRIKELMNLTKLDTPALVLDLDRLEANAAAMAARMQQHHVTLRPHLKTAKSADVAAVARKHGAAGIAVATLKEAEYFAQQGYKDLQYPVCITPDKYHRAAALVRQGADLGLILDSLETARTLSSFAEHEGIRLKVYLEVDCGEHRTGFSLDDPDFLAAAGVLNSSDQIDFQGVLTHGGHSYYCGSEAEVRAVAEQERSIAVMAAEILRSAGIACKEVSIGSTPTARFAESFEGVTEVRAGVYLFGDLFQAGLHTCGPDSLAVSVLTTVISYNRRTQRIFVDAGGLALSKDKSRARGAPELGYGQVASIDGEFFHPRAIVADVHQEHGEISAGEIPGLQQLGIGARLRIYPNHACMTAAMYGTYHVVRGTSTKVETIWEKTQGW